MRLCKFLVPHLSYTVKPIHFSKFFSIIIYSAHSPQTNHHTRPPAFDNDPFQQYWYHRRYSETRHASGDSSNLILDHQALFFCEGEHSGGSWRSSGIACRGVHFCLLACGKQRGYLNNYSWSPWENDFCSVVKSQHTPQIFVMAFRLGENKALTFCGSKGRTRDDFSRSSKTSQGFCEKQHLAMKFGKSL
jgi:hypothetical protein